MTTRKYQTRRRVVEVEEYTGTMFGSPVTRYIVNGPGINRLDIGDHEFHRDYEPVPETVGGVSSATLDRLDNVAQEHWYIDRDGRYESPDKQERVDVTDHLEDDQLLYDIAYTVHAYRALLEAYEKAVGEIGDIQVVLAAEDEDPPDHETVMRRIVRLASDSEYPNATIASLRAQLEKAVGALEFYAERENYNPVWDSNASGAIDDPKLVEPEPVTLDGGDLARTTLAEIRGSDG